MFYISMYTPMMLHNLSIKFKKKQGAISEVLPQNTQSFKLKPHNYVQTVCSFSATNHSGDAEESSAPTIILRSILRFKVRAQWAAPENLGCDGLRGTAFIVSSFLTAFSSSLNILNTSTVFLSMVRRTACEANQKKHQG